MRDRLQSGKNQAVWCHLWAILPACCMLFVGCQSKVEFGTVEGIVTMDGQPITDVSLTFTPTDGRRKSIAITDPDGWYELHYSTGRMGAWTGEHLVTISTAEWSEGDDGLHVTREETIPAMYNTDSSLIVNVTDAENIINFDLFSEGEIRLPDFVTQSLARPGYGAGADSESPPDDARSVPTDSPSPSDDSSGAHAPSVPDLLPETTEAEPSEPGDDASAETPDASANDSGKSPAQEGIESPAEPS